MEKSKGIDEVCTEFLETLRELHVDDDVYIAALRAAEGRIQAECYRIGRLQAFAASLRAAEDRANRQRAQAKGWPIPERGDI